MPQVPLPPPRGPLAAVPNEHLDMVGSSLTDHTDIYHMQLVNRRLHRLINKWLCSLRLTGRWRPLTAMSGVKLTVNTSSNMPPRAREVPPAPPHVKNAADPRHAKNAAAPPRHAKNAAAVPTLDDLPHEPIVEIGKSLTRSRVIYHVMQTCRTMRAIFDNQLYRTAVSGSNRLKLGLTHNHAAVRRLLATGALAVGLEFYPYVRDGFVECTSMVNVGIELMDEEMARRRGADRAWPAAQGARRAGAPGQRPLRLGVDDGAVPRRPPDCVCSALSVRRRPSGRVCIARSL
ncbi:hypothetical protein FN846DRAFT_887342 [Sphaerosporella brunnea]|uniref:F-box domain-containing protein n=1 Tax=Sphaerosporella brunnea TaxID=1250544 RepID=A0A5J5F5W9_9PEZI|nr:hypothetical protein FN846DRAFT_887342 [Sphaerosporella brunnea]